MTSSNQSNQNPLLSAFFSSAAKNPDRIALEDSTSFLTFSELADEIRLLASSIRALQHKYKYYDYIPLFVGRDIESGLLILACYLYSIPFSPIDSDWPGDRVAYVLAKLGDPAFSLAGRIKLDESLRDLALSSLFDIAALKRQTRNQEYALTQQAGEKGYVLFTSGTTGQPKGVEFHQLAVHQKARYYIARDDRDKDVPSQEVYAFMGFPLNFTAGIGRLLGLVFGQTIRILSVPEMAVDSLFDLVRNLRPSVLRLPPSLVLLLSSYEPKLGVDPLLDSVKQVTWGGDAVSFSTVNRLRKFFSPETIMIAGFGATEATTNLSFKFTLGESPTSGAIPIGMQDSIKISMKREVEGLGEKFVLLSQEPLATGYLGDPDLTKTRFGVDAEGNRFWDSGDILEIDTNGFVWHRGRLDDLVKIRGKLTSPSEATQALLKIPGILDAIVLPVEQDGVKRLEAHIALASSGSPTLVEIRSKLASILPTHLIPSRFVAHDSIPKNSRGKPDRSLLLSSKHSYMVSDSKRKPFGKTERIIHSHVQEVLGVHEISIDDNLWESGLDSLAALELESKLAMEFGESTLDAITRSRNIGEIAKILDSTVRLNSHLPVVLNPEGKEPAMFAFPGMSNRSIHFVHLANALNGNTPIICLLSKYGDLSRANTTINGRVTSSLAQLNEEQMKFRIIGYSFGGVLAFELSKELAKKQIFVELTLFDTSPEMMTTKGKTRATTLQQVQRHKSQRKVKLSALFHRTLMTVRKHGLKRFCYLLFVDKPLELLMTIQTFRDLMRMFPQRIFTRSRLSFQARVIELLMRNDAMDYEFIPMSQEESKYVDAVLVHVQSNSDYSHWNELIPGIKFLSTPGSHSNMLNPPNVQYLVESLQIIRKKETPNYLKQ